MNMREKYEAMIGMAHPFTDKKDLYDILIQDNHEDTYVLVWPKGDYAINLIKPSCYVGRDMNLEHLHRLGIDPNDEEREDLRWFFGKHKDKCIFGDALTFYSRDLDTESHPIPRLLMMTHNLFENRERDDSLGSLYTDVLNYLAKEDNRALFQSLTPESISRHQKDGTPIFFHQPTWDYGEEPDSYSYLSYDLAIQVPKTGSFESIIESIKGNLEGMM
jgi:hypothetical protein